MRIHRTAGAFFALAVCAVGAWAGDISRDDLKKALDQNPDLVLDALGKNKKKLYDLISQAAQEARAEQQKAQQEAEKKEFEEAFRKPKVPEIDKKTHVRGTKGAKYTLVEYSDFQCPYCGRGYQTVESLRKKYGSDLRFIFKNMPLPFHSQAMPAAKFFEAAMLQSTEKGWLFHDKMFQNQSNLSEAFCKDTAKELGLDVEKLVKDAEGQEVKDRIEADVREAKSFGFEGTPGFLLNGVPIRGAYPVDYFESIVKRFEEMKSKK